MLHVNCDRGFHNLILDNCFWKVDKKYLDMINISQMFNYCQIIRSK